MRQRSVRALATRPSSSSTARRSRHCQRSPPSVRIRAGEPTSSRATSCSCRDDGLRERFAHIQLASADQLLSTYYRFQIRTFWIGVVYLVTGIALTSAVIGIAVLFWWFVWSLVRNLKVVLA